MSHESLLEKAAPIPEEHDFSYDLLEQVGEDYIQRRTRGGFHQAQERTMALERQIVHLAESESTAATHPGTSGRYPKVLRSLILSLGVLTSHTVRAEAPQPPPAASAAKRPSTTGVINVERPTTEAIPHFQELKRIAREFGLEFSIDVENGNGPYIIHIGQQHSLDYDYSLTSNPFIREEIITRQVAIEALLLKLKELLRPEEKQLTVFQEGFVDANEKLFHSLSPIIEKISAIETNEQAWSRIMELYDRLTTKNKKLLDDPELNAYFHYMFYHKIQELQHAFAKQSSGAPNNPAQEQLITSILKECDQAIFGGIKKGADSKVYLQDKQPFMWGAGNKLFLEGSVELLSPETLQDNEDAWKKSEEYDEALNNLLTAMKEKASPQKRIQLTEDVGLKRKLKDHSVYTVRENRAIDSIVSAPDFTERNFSILVYGNDHRFQDNVIEHNQQQPSRRVGLMTFRLKEKRGE